MRAEEGDACDSSSASKSLGVIAEHPRDAFLSIGDWAVIAHLSRGVYDTRISAASVSIYVSGHGLKKDKMVGIFVQEVSSGGGHGTQCDALEACPYHYFRSVNGVLL